MTSAFARPAPRDARCSFTGSRTRIAAVVLLLALVAGGCAPAAQPPLLVLPSVDLSDPGFYPTLEAHTGAAIVPGNTVTFLRNGDEIFPAILRAIRGARTTITYSQYYVSDGVVAREIVGALAERCRAGVGVNVLLDGFGALDMSAASQDELRRAGCALVMFRPLTPFGLNVANHRNHRRLLVVDGRIGFTGGSGVADKWQGDGHTAGHWRDTDVRVEGEVVRSMQAAFVELWREATGVVLGGDAYFPQLAPRGDIAGQLITSSPVYGDYGIETAFLLAITAARRTIFITTPYFVVDGPLRDALLAAVQRGVRVALLLPGPIDVNVVRAVSRRSFGELLRGGVELYEYQPALLHAKTMVVDDVWVAVGSANFDTRSLSLNAEDDLVLYGATVGRELTRIFCDDMSHAQRLTLADWRRRPLGQRLLELLAIPLRPEL